MKLFLKFITIFIAFSFQKTQSQTIDTLVDVGNHKLHFNIIKGKGIPSINGYGNGDLLVHVNVWTPKTLNKEQKQFFEKNLEDDNFTPSPEKTDKSFFEKVKDMFSQTVF